MFPPMTPTTERVRANAENQLLEKNAALRAQYQKPVRLNFGWLRLKLWRRPAVLKPQHNPE